MRVSSVFNSSVTDRPTDRPTDGRTHGRTDKASYRVACPQLKTNKNIVQRGKQMGMKPIESRVRANTNTSPHLSKEEDKPKNANKRAKMLFFSFSCAKKHSQDPTFTQLAHARINNQSMRLTGKRRNRSPRGNMWSAMRYVMPQNHGAIWGHILVRVLALITIPLHSDEPDLALKTTAQFGREYGARSRVLFLLQNL